MRWLLLVLLLVPVPSYARMLTADPSPEAVVVALPVDVSASDATYEARLRRIEERIIGIKERIFQTKTRMMFMHPGSIDNVIAESRAVLLQHNALGSFFELQSVQYWLDRKQIYLRDNTGGGLDAAKDFAVYDGSVIPGSHTLKMEVVVRGRSGAFAYMDAYRWKLRSSYTFYAARGRVTEVGIDTLERGGLGTALEDRPTVEYRVRQMPNRR